MKKLKLAFWLIIIAFFALLIYQNLDFFSNPYSLKIDLGVYERQTPEMTTGAIMASFVGISVLIMLVFYLTSRFENFRAKKTIKSLTHALDESSQVIAGLKSDLEGQQPGETEPAVEPTPAGEETAETPEAEEAETTVNPATSA